MSNGQWQPSTECLLSWSVDGDLIQLALILTYRALAAGYWTIFEHSVTWNWLEIAGQEFNAWVWRCEGAQQDWYTFFQMNRCWFSVIRDDKGPRPDVEISGNSTICVPVIQIHENTSKFHREHLPLWIIDQVKIALRPRANLRPLFSSMQMAAITYSISIDRFMSLFEVLWQIDKH